MKRTVAVLTGPKTFDFVEQEIPLLRANEVLLKVISVGLCHSDVPAYLGTSAAGFHARGYGAMIKNVPYPMPLGHEPVCKVDAVGKAVTRYKPGEFVTGFLLESFATHLLVPEDAQMMKIPQTSKPIDACIGEPMMCVSNIARAVTPKLGDKIAVIGCGFMGLMVISALKGRNLGELVAIDFDDNRLQLASKYGATRIMNPAKVDIEDVSYDLTGGKFYDCVVEITGSLKGLASALKISKLPGHGRILAPSVYAKEVLWDVEMGYNLMYRSPEIHVVHPWYTDDYMGVFRIGVEAYIKGVFPTNELITHRIPFSEIGKGFELLSRNPPEYIKGIITFE